MSCICTKSLHRFLQSIIIWKSYSSHNLRQHGRAYYTKQTQRFFNSPPSSQLKERLSFIHHPSLLSPLLLQQ
ncbi:hypothetical protein L6452_13085 [Arctium lappa]|uniref:Uncharacterized protein n=1 Tax=Arctium lappa TaxID=4217 RepID=A0ACB9CH66_ARCLA|nr:hypothetical protein L6452_13085 [Arctium lappa]